MSKELFDAHLAGLEAEIFRCLEAYLRNQNLPFDRETFIEHSVVDMNEFAREVMFFGADTFPDIENLENQKIIN